MIPTTAVFDSLSQITIMSFKPIIAVDIDEVLADFIPTLASFHNVYYECEKTLTADSFFSYEFHNVWGGTREECLKKVSFFRVHVWQ